ncbi:MAG: chromosomal replication initiator protein DnaA [Nitriliruptoraceae bacterium]
MTSASTLDLDSLWTASLAQVMREVSSPAQRQWLAATHPVGFSNDTIVVASPHSFAREWLERHCGAALRAALSAAAGRDLAVVITVQTHPAPVDGPTAGAGSAAQAPLTPPDDPSPTSNGQEASLDRLPPAPFGHLDDPPAVAAWAPAEGGAVRDERIEQERLPLHAPGRPDGPTVELPARPRRHEEEVEPDTQLNPKYSFDDFVIGSSNRFAHAAATAVAEAPAKSYNPLFIYGGAGLGKTHLLHAIGHYVRNLYPRLKVRYITTEQFTNEFINAIRDDRITAFQRTYRQADVLLVDDIQFLQQKERTQEEFFHTFNALHNAEKQIVISSDRPPKQIAHLEDRLRSRFEWGLMTDVQPPDLETRIAILRKKSETDALQVTPEVLELIASRVQSNIRELEGALIRVAAFSSLQRAPADTAMAEAVLKDLFPDGRNREISVQLIMEEVADHFALTVEDLCSPSRSRQLVTARQLAMYLTRELTELSLPRIGKAFGGRDHTTVMHATKKIAALMQERRAIYDQVQELTNRVKTRARTA